jgi:hypothetical protein
MSSKLLASTILAQRLFEKFSRPVSTTRERHLKAASSIKRTSKYQALAASVSHSRKGMITKGKETFDCFDWSKVCNGKRAVLTNSPNSCPPERLFSFFNATYNDDQMLSQLPTEQ